MRTKCDKVALRIVSQKIFEKLFKNPLTNHSKCDIIYTSKGTTLENKKK
jgi:hypothetical protein